ncbi:hypothetical protein Q757_05960 [Oenococcus alcoholitolerans]|uniref:Uncharacterized protein n=1 Tax=Oenococcus alcoholitolerans TaxID=931074 RepID=A0ABR4XQI8_9LACO|nr:hypothetical protein Q757_05960 [Oenococcus alcoholitolerans]
MIGYYYKNDPQFRSAKEDLSDRSLSLYSESSFLKHENSITLFLKREGKLIMQLDATLYQDGSLLLDLSGEKRPIELFFEDLSGSFLFIDESWRNFFEKIHRRFLKKDLNDKETFALQDENKRFDMTFEADRSGDAFQIIFQVIE